MHAWTRWIAGGNRVQRSATGVIPSLLKPTVSSATTHYTPGISERRGAAVTQYLHSGLKNADARTSGQAIDATRQYDAFGNLTSSSGTWPGPFGYAGGFGYQEDAESGLMLLGHRYYDSTTGRFLSKDPIGDGRNWYGYCNNDPIPFRDPNGLEPVGHHIVPRAVWKDGKYSDEASKVFDSAVTGPIPGGHNFGDGHSDYSKAVQEHIDAFCRRNKIERMRMTAQQAKQFIDALLSSADPRTAPYLSRLYKRLGKKTPRSFEELGDFALKRAARKLGPKVFRALLKKLPVIGWIWFGYDWVLGGFGHAANEALWPLSELWGGGGN